MRTYTRPFSIARLLLGLALMLLAPLAGFTSAAYAATVTQVADCTFATLRTDLQAGGDYYYAVGQCPNPIVFTSAITISSNASLTTHGHDITLDGGNSVRLFNVNSGVSFGLTGLILSHGSATSDNYNDGGAIYNQGALTITESTFSGNSASGYGGGGAIANESAGTLTITRSTFSGNSADYHGGAIMQIGSAVTVTASTFSGNASDYSGGAIEDSSGSLTVKTSTFFGNSARYGGAIDNFDTTSITNSTFAGNSASRWGGSIATEGKLTIGGTIIASTTSDDCYRIQAVAITDKGYNLENGSNCGLSGTGSLQNTDPKLDPNGLQNNGGPTQTIALQSSSPAIDAIPTSSGLCPATDQRGTAVPDDNESFCDIGAYESGNVGPPYSVGPIQICPSGCTYSQIQPALDFAYNGDSIAIAAGTYSGGLSISKSVNLAGAGAGSVIIQGGDSVVTVGGGTTVRIQGVTITGGNAYYYGGGIQNHGNLTLANSTVSGNTTNDRISYSGGGGIENVGSLTVINSTISGNSAQQGGGIHNGFGSTVTLINSTISGNRANYSVGGILSNNNVTVSGTIIAKNTASAAPDCAGSLKDGPGGHNLLGDNSSCSGLTDGVNGNQVGTASNPIDPKLGPLADNGGPTQTMALLPGSPAISAGDATTCQSLVGPNGDHDTDQRGRPRNSASRGTCDIGAYDTGVNPPPNQPPTTSASTTPASPNGANGWFTSDVAVNLSATDNDDSGVKSITYSVSGAQTIAATTVNAASASLTISTEGTTTISYYATDTAGSVETAQTLTIKLDKTAPSITASATKADGTAYTAGSWTNQNVTVSFSCSDATSGVAPGACPASLTISAEGTTNPVSGPISDQAGNSASASFGPILIDKTAPTITFANRSAPNAAGWNNSAVAVSWTCSDALSGAAAANVSQTLTSEGANQSATGTCTDKAGNSASDTQSGINIDRTAPSGVSGTPTTSPNASGWYNAPVTIMFSGTDTTSGIAGCTSASYTGPDSSSASLSGSCTDRAGNTSAAVASSSFKYDATAPTLAPSVSPNPVLLNGSATASANASDATSGSGIASQSCGAVGTSSIGAKSISCSATDKAGNSASANANYSVIYNFSGFFSPVANAPTLNQMKGGSSVALTFSLAGNQGLNILATNFPASRPIDCSTLAALGSYQPTNPSSNSGLTYNAKTNQYTYSWKTDKAWTGTCRQFDLKLNDSTEHFANFKFK